MMNNIKARVIAFYLPQFHPIPENDKWWGKGFTEWTNVGKAKPLFKGHYQPRVPADLGYYDLRMPEIREAQAQMAREAGIEGFCYWHYWFGNGKRLLERPFNEVLESGKPDYPFCLGWANHSWNTRTWDPKFQNKKDSTIIEQLYPGIDDYINHFNTVLPAFKDNRYIKIDGKPVFVVFDPVSIPDANFFIEQWNSLAKENGLSGIHFIGLTHNNPSFKRDGKKFSLKASCGIVANQYSSVLEMGFSAVNSRGYSRAQLLANGIFYSYTINKINRALGLGYNKVKYKKLIKHMFVKEDCWENVYPTIVPNYDRSPRSGKNAVIWYGSTPKLFKKHVEDALKVVENKKQDHKIIFLKSWNEWGETNYVEPDVLHGKGYLDILKECLLSDK
jgi:hypothetical protein